ncbi:DUF2231 domain-containing protein [Sphingosinicella sp.]|uniref:DUF2231 domain-containing protein n=1 Tax=Sphingosinicella sp. TaxID=1917971 RepID=UPI00403781BD
MVLNIRLLLATLCLIALPLVAAPAGAHKNHNEVQAAEQAQQNGAGAIADHATNPAASAHTMDMEEQRPTTFGGRLVSFAGRMHPFAVHFPIALFPISWIALVFARRRGDRVDLIRAFIVVAGVAAVIAAALGWLNAGFQLADRDPIRSVHRWIGSGLALAGITLALWAWRRPDSVNSRGMTLALGTITLILLVQGWFGAALTHGVEHMMF